MKDSKAHAYIMAIASMLIFGSIGLFRRMIPLSSSLLAFSRGILGSCFLLLCIKLRGNKPEKSVGIKSILLLALTGGLMGLNWILLFEAYNYTTVAAATMSYYMEPTIVILASPLILHERLTVRRVICAAAAVIGMLLVSGVLTGGFGGAEGLKGIGLGLCAAVLYSSVVIMNKLIPAEDNYTRTFIELLGSAVILIPYLAVSGEFSSVQADIKTLLLVILVGIIHTGIAYVLYFGSITRLSGQSSALISYIDPVSALLLSALVLHEELPVAGIIGSVLIILSAAAGETDPGKLIKRSSKNK